MSPPHSLSGSLDGLDLRLVAHDGRGGVAVDVVDHVAVDLGVLLRERDIIGVSGDAIETGRSYGMGTVMQEDE